MLKLKTSTVIWTFIWCIFMGVTVGSIGIGATVPSANLIASPFVCPDGKMTLVTEHENPSSVESVTITYWYCVDRSTGSQVELGIFPMVLYSGAIYGFILFLLVLIGMIISANRQRANAVDQNTGRF